MLPKKLLGRITKKIWKTRILKKPLKIATKWSRYARFWPKSKNSIFHWIRRFPTFSFHSKILVEVLNLCKDMLHKFSLILENEVDPKGKLRIPKAAMRLYVKKNEKVHLLDPVYGTCWGRGWWKWNSNSYKKGQNYSKLWFIFRDGGVYHVILAPIQFDQKK